jgi:DNA polymerase-3 subunit gamma/tau
MRGLDMAGRLPMRALTRTWQMLLKALEETAAAPNTMMAAEMAIIRLTHVADLPSPEDLVRRLGDAPPPPAQGGGGPTGGGQMRGAPTASVAAPAPRPVPQVQATSSGGVTALAVQSENALARYARFEQVVDLIRSNRDMQLLIEVETGLRLARYEPGRIEFSPAPGAPRDLASRLGQRLQLWTGARWAVTVVNEGGAPTIDEVRTAKHRAEVDRAATHPLVIAVLKAFPDAEITEIRAPEALEAEAAAAALPEVEDEWDPFEED